MVRVISGTAGGLKLQTLDSGFTRPTLGRVKEAVFSMIQEEIYAASVLDLFAGNGALRRSAEEPRNVILTTKAESAAR